MIESRRMVKDDNSEELKMVLKKVCIVEHKLGNVGYSRYRVRV